MVQTRATSKYQLDLSEVEQDIIAKVDDTYDLGSQTKRWAYLYAVIAVLTSLTIGGIYLGATTEGWFLINASTQINGSLLVTENVTADYFFGNGSQLTGVLAGNPFDQSLNTADNVLFNDLNLSDDLLMDSSGEIILNIDNAGDTGFYADTDDLYIQRTGLWFIRLIDGLLEIDQDTQFNDFIQFQNDINGSGDITAGNFIGNGSQLTDVSAVIDWTNVAFYNESVEWAGHINATGTVRGANLFGDLACTNITGATSDLCTIVDTSIGNCSVKDSCPLIYYLQGLSGENITSGTVADARIADTIARDTELITNCSVAGSCSDVAYMNYDNIGNFNISGSLNVSQNISQGTNDYHCWGDDCPAFAYHNGSSLIIKVT